MGGRWSGCGCRMGALTRRHAHTAAKVDRNVPAFSLAVLTGHRHHGFMKRPLIVLGISIVMIVMGTAVCVPGVCSCVSWLGIPDSRFSILFILMWMGGFIGVGGSLIWLFVAAVWKALHLRVGS